MNHIHPMDRQTLTAMLGTESLPDGFEVEYQAQLRLFHRSGMSGPLGAALLIGICRMFDMSAPVYKPPVNVDWSKLEKGSWILVNDKPARFRGVIGSGTISYVLPGESVAMEIGAGQVAIHPDPPQDEPEDTRNAVQKSVSK